MEAKFAASFDKYDKDGKGSLDIIELKAMLRSINYHPGDKLLSRMMKDAKKQFPDGDTTHPGAPRLPPLSPPAPS
jgi:Ca2+-binding EF-hand superfamily protein